MVHLAGDAIKEANWDGVQHRGQPPFGANFEDNGEACQNPTFIRASEQFPRPLIMAVALEVPPGALLERPFLIH